MRLCTSAPAPKPCRAAAVSQGPVSAPSCCPGMGYQHLNPQSPPTLPGLMSRAPGFCSPFLPTTALGAAEAVGSRSAGRALQALPPPASSGAVRFSFGFPQETEELSRVCLSILPLGRLAMTGGLLGGAETTAQNQPVPTGVLGFYEVTPDGSCHRTPSQQPGYRLEVTLSLPSVRKHELPSCPRARAPSSLQCQPGSDRRVAGGTRPAPTEGALGKGRQSKRHPPAGEVPSSETFANAHDKSSHAESPRSAFTPFCDVSVGLWL